MHIQLCRELSLIKIIARVDPLGRHWQKRSFAKMRWYKLKSGRAMLAATRDRFAHYAAADAWATIQSYIWFHKHGSHTAPPQELPPVTPAKASISRPSRPPLYNSQPDGPRKLGPLDWTDSDSDYEDISAWNGPGPDCGMRV